MTRDNPTFVALDEARAFAAGRDVEGVMRSVNGDELRRLAPQAIGVSLEVAEGGELTVERRNDMPAALSKPTPARVPEWVRDSAKWQTMTRAERRAVERHHRRVTGRR